MSDITVINDSEQSSLVTNGLAKNGELYLKAAGSTDAGAIVVYDSGSWRTFANEASAGFSNTYSLEFDGTNDGARVNTPITLSNSSAWTISMWMKMVTPGTQVDTDDSSTFNNNGTQYFRVLHYNTGWYATNGPYWYFEIGNNGAMYLQYKFDAGPDFADWVHVAYVHDGSANYKIFLNGVQRTTSGSNHSAASDFYIDYVYGRAGTAQSGSFKHDELAIFDNDQSSNISTIYNSGVAGDLSSYSANLTHWYSMEEGSGSTVANSGSASSSDLNLQNTPIFSTDIPS